MASNHSPLIAVKQDGRVLTVRLDRESKKNSLTLEMYEQMVSILKNVDADSSVHVVLLSGGARIFCAGNDIGDFIASPPVKKDEPVWRFIAALSGFSKPIVAAVNGLAIGIGATMLLHCDIVYAARDSKFSLPFVNLGLSPEAGSSLLLQRVAGPRTAAEMLLTGNVFDANRAKEAGLVTSLLDPELVFTHAYEQAMALSSKPLTALIATKSLMKRAEATPLADQIQAEIDVFGHLVVQDAAKEAFSKFATT